MLQGAGRSGMSGSLSTRPGWRMYGIQVEWSTIEHIAATGAIDLWILFPLGIGLNWLLPRSGLIPEGWRQRLNLFWGRSD
jgi:hypothetical protein